MADYNFITPRVAVGGGIWTRDNLEELIRAGVTHIINAQAEFDERTLLNGNADEPDILWLATEDDFEPKPFDYFSRGVDFAQNALAEPESRLLVHCASGVHRAPMLALAILRVQGFGRREALRMVRARRPEADFPGVYLDSVEAFMAEWACQ